MQEETNNILHQRTRNSWRKKSICTLMLLPERMKQITKCRTLQVHVVVENWILMVVEKEEPQKIKELRKTLCFPELAHATNMDLLFAGKTDAAKLFSYVLETTPRQRQIQVRLGC
jgi:ADP-dependent phosphofructokinase/glucokinase